MLPSQNMPIKVDKNAPILVLRLTAEVRRVDTTLYSLFLYLHSTKQLEALGPVPLSMITSAAGMLAVYPSQQINFSVYNMKQRQLKPPN